MKNNLDRIGGRIYNRLLSAILGVVAFIAFVSGLVIILTDNILFGSVWLGSGIFFGIIAHRLWCSRSTLRETFDGHG